MTVPTHNKPLGESLLRAILNDAALVLHCNAKAVWEALDSKNYALSKTSGQKEKNARVSELSSKTQKP